MAIEKIRIPDFGDVQEITVVEILIKPGDRIDKEAPLLTLESEKAVMDLPSPYSGMIKEVLVKEEAKVASGDVMPKRQRREKQKPKEKNKRRRRKSRKSLYLKKKVKISRTRKGRQKRYFMPRPLFGLLPGKSRSIWPPSSGRVPAAAS